MKILLQTVLFTFSFLLLDAQKDSLLLQGHKDLNKRSKIVLTSTVSAYAATATSLYFAWYSNYDQDGFHFFNDWKEWEQIDKIGHAYSGYTQAYLLHNAFLWSGQSRKKALNTATWISLGFQTSIEIMDGFSSEWGFSLADMGFNVIGTGSYFMQEKLWGHQKVRFKYGYWPATYSETKLNFENSTLQITAQERADALFGSHPIEKMLKDYNGQSIWLSLDIDAIFPGWTGPDWLDLAIGFGAQNMFGGFQNGWWLENEFILMDQHQFPRSKQFFLALDYDLTAVKTNSPFLRTLLDGLNILKLPAPAIEYNTTGQWRFHLLFPLHF